MKESVKAWLWLITVVALGLAGVAWEVYYRMALLNAVRGR